MPARPRDPGGDIPLDQQSGPVEIPQSARDRLSRMEDTDDTGDEGGKRGFFTSDLSTDEFLLIKEAGFDPVGMVVGSSIYHVGYQPTYMTAGGFGMGYSYQEQELNVLTQAKYKARELAMARMEAEAQALDADGIVGVRLDTGAYEWGADLVEFKAVGTAVRARDKSKSASYRTRFGKPFTSDLSGQDLRTLLHAGYRPLGLVMGISVYETFQNGYEYQQLFGYRWGMVFTGNYNVEVERFTQAIYAARNLAMSRMQHEATQLGAEGIVGVQLKMERDLSKTDEEFEGELREEHAVPSQIWRTFLVDMFAVGTAVAPISADHQIPTPSMVLELNG